jgi:hypothetical protein
MLGADTATGQPARLSLVSLGSHHTLEGFPKRGLAALCAVSSATAVRAADEAGAKAPVLVMPLMIS